MSDKIKPALTPEEWVSYPAADLEIRDGEYEVALIPAMIPSGAIIAIPTDYVGGDEYQSTGPDCVIPAGALHALAALALHGQPFGFTWEDVDLLRRAAEDAGVGLYGEEERAEAGRDFSALAARIAALLPPRNP